MLKKPASLALIILLFSCQTPNTNVHTDSSKTNKITPQLGANNFTTKKIQSDDLGLIYTGDWSFSTPTKDPYPIPSVSSTPTPIGYKPNNAPIDDTENGFVSKASFNQNDLQRSESWIPASGNIINDGKSMDEVVPSFDQRISYSPKLSNVSTGLGTDKYSFIGSKTYNYNDSNAGKVIYSPSGWIPNIL